MKQAVVSIAICFLLGIPGAFALGIPQIQYLSKEDFLAQAFADKPGWDMLRLDRETKSRIRQILEHPYPAGRIRYWQQGSRTAWIIDEIGKDQPITMGVVVDNDAIVEIKILVYREERGGEVREEHFTRQFVNVTLKGDGLSKSIDGITGATLSVNAVTKAAAMALVLHRLVQPDQVVQQ